MRNDSSKRKTAERSRARKDAEEDENARRRNIMMDDIKSMIKDYKNKANYSDMVEGVSS